MNNYIDFSSDAFFGEESEREDIDLENRIMSTSYTPGDDAEVSLRPKCLADYVGQDKAKENLKVYIEAAKLRGDTLDHVLLYGPPGLGKTTLSNIIAAELGVNIRIPSGPAIEKQGDLAALLTNLNQGDVLFIDEIHRLPRTVEEILYPAMEDFALDIIIGKGPAAPARGKFSEAQDALLVLGYSRAEAQGALKSVDPTNLSVEDIIKEALKRLMKS